MSYISKTEEQAIQELKRDKDKLLLTTDKGVTMVVMDRKDYIHKSSNLSFQPTYRPIPPGPHQQN